MTGSKGRAVAVGGGTGQPNALRCLLEIGYDTTAVVTVADDGGSSGHLRRELGMLPPGDARNCLVALADTDSPFARVFQYRFAEGEGLAGHALGNLIIAALADIEGSFPAALDDAARLLGARGRVLPSTLCDCTLTAVDVDGNRIVGQVEVAENTVPIHRVRFLEGTPEPYAPTLEAISEADLVVVGPGSLYTSLLPNFLVRGVTDALRDAAAKVAYVCNVANQRGETGGMDALGYVRALLDHGLSGAIDVVLVDDTAPGAPDQGLEPVGAGTEVLEAVRELGVEVVTAPLADPRDPRHHGHDLLRAALEKVI